MARFGKILSERGLSLKLDKSMREFLTREGFDPVYGARPLKRMIQKWIQSPLARYVLENEPPRDTEITAYFNPEARAVSFRAHERKPRSV